MQTPAVSLHFISKRVVYLTGAFLMANLAEIKGRMEKDMDEAVKMARIMKEKLSRISQGVLVPVLNNMSTGHAYPGLTVPVTLDPSTLSMIT